MATAVRDRAKRGKAPSAAKDGPEPGISHNLNGQRLGRKGRDTRDRILAATAELLAEPGGMPLSLSAVARRTSLGMSSLYLYFNDLTELLIAVLEPVMATAEEAYIARMRTRWPDAGLAACCQKFVRDYHAFWLKNSRILHLRNSMADLHDSRLMQHRVDSALPVIRLLVAQMDGDTSAPATPEFAMASMLMTGIERAATIWTDTELPGLLDAEMFGNADRFRMPAARLLELGIRDARSRVSGLSGR